MYSSGRAISLTATHLSCRGWKERRSAAPRCSLSGHSLSTTPGRGWSGNDGKVNWGTFLIVAGWRNGRRCYPDVQPTTGVGEKPPHLPRRLFRGSGSPSRWEKQAIRSRIRPMYCIQERGNTRERASSIRPPFVTPIQFLIPRLQRAIEPRSTS